jgi:hypothetical protein
MALSPCELERNDVERALECYDQAVEEGATHAEMRDLLHVLLRLQDRPEVLLSRLSERRPRRAASENRQERGEPRPDEG